MQIIEPNPQSVQIQNSQHLADLAHGLFIIAPEHGLPNGKRFRVIKTQLADGNFNIQCHRFVESGTTEAGTPMSKESILGYLTQEGVNKITKHEHECSTKLELKSDEAL